MPRMSTCYNERAVVVAVYVETSRKRRLPSNNHHHCSRHHYVYLLQQQKQGGANGGGYDRRAELLDYTRRLRESARSGPSSTSHPKPVPPNNQQPMSQISAVRSKPKQNRFPTCLGSLKAVIPSILRSLTTFKANKGSKKKKRDGESIATKVKGVMKSFQVR